MSTLVQLACYDLSQGMARNMSLALTGKFIEAIWHTAVIVHGIEVWYGQGILTSTPGQTHHGLPLKILPMGETHIDRETLFEYIAAIKDVYRADRYHLLEFNCNTFTNDVINFLCGKSIPQDIIDLPKDFLSTPFGQSLRPMIEQMFRRGSSSTPEALQSVRTLTNQQHLATSPSAFQTLSSPLTITSNLASFDSLLNANDIVVAMFTRAGCPPCATIKPVFEDLAFKYSPIAADESDSISMTYKTPQQSIAFTIIDTHLASSVASKYDIRATPTFLFFANGGREHVLQGPNQQALKDTTAALITQVYPPHPHSRLTLPTLTSLSTAPVQNESVPNIEGPLRKLRSFLEPLEETAKFKSVYSGIATATIQQGHQLSLASASQWNEANVSLLAILQIHQVFPILDLLRMACLSLPNATLLLPSIEAILSRVREFQADRVAYTLSLKVLTNALPAVPLKRRPEMTQIMVDGLLHDDERVQAAAATLAIRSAQLEFQKRPNWLSKSADSDQESFEIEILTAACEALKLGFVRPPDAQSGTIICHRLLATVGLILFKSSFCDELLQLLPALEFGKPEVTKISEQLAARDRALGFEIAQLFD